MSTNSDESEDKELITLEEDEYYSRLNSSFANGKIHGVEEVLSFINSWAGITFTKGNKDTANILLELAKKIKHLSTDGKLEVYVSNLVKNDGMLPK